MEERREKGPPGSRVLSKSLKPPVSFDLFSKSIKNLPDIAFQIQCQELKKGVSKSLDDCAKWYYREFYINPSVRQEYEFKLNSISLNVKKKILYSSSVGLPYIRSMSKKVIGDQQVDKKKKQPINEVDINTEITGQSSIVSFDVFEKYVKNLYDIVCKLKLLDPDYACKGYEDCAETFYYDFYINPEIREKYPLELKNCPPLLRDKIFYLPSREEVKELQKQYNGEQPITENIQDINSIVTENLDRNVRSNYSVELNIGNLGRFLFPVSIDVFKSFINYDDIIEPLLMLKGINDNCQRSRLKANHQDPICQETFELYYHSFYMYAERRELVPYKFPNASEKMMRILLSCGQPLDAAAETTMKNSHLAMSVPTKNMLYPISFTQFQKLIKNLNEIVQQMMQCEEYNYLPASQECYKKEYYKLFYASPKIRERFAYKLAPCPALHRKKVLRIPTISKEVKVNQESTDNNQEVIAKNQESADKTPEVVAMNQEPVVKTKESADKNQKSVVENQASVAKTKESVDKNQESVAKNQDSVVKTKESVDKNQDSVVKTINGKLYAYPVSMKVWWQYINSEELIVQLRDIHENHKREHGGPNFTDEQLISRFYNYFYYKSDVRKTVQFNFDKAPKEMQEKLLATAKEIPAKLAHQKLEKVSKTSSKIESLKSGPADGLNEPAANVFPKEDNTNDEVDYENAFPVTFETFKSYIQNLSEIAKQMQLSDKYRDKTEKECCLEYYKEFYSSIDIRKKFRYKLKPCPSMMKQKILSVVPPIYKNKNMILDSCTTDYKRKTPELGHFKWPVSFETFKKYINYAEIYRPALSHIITDESVLANPENPQCLKLFRRYYNSFYIHPHIRRKYPYKFNCPDEELLQKLLSYAEPLDETAKQTVAKGISQAKEATEAHPLLEDSSNTLNAGPGSDSRASDVPEIRKLDQLNDEHLDPSLHKKGEQNPPPPVSFKIFSSLLHLDEVVDKMKNEPIYAQMSPEDCKMAYYHAFYTMPSIRDKYPCQMKPCPGRLKTKLLSIPETRRTEEKESSMDERNKVQNMKSVAELYAEKKLQLASKTKVKLVIYHLLRPNTRKDTLPVTEEIPGQTSTDSFEAENMSNIAEKSASVSNINDVVIPGATHNLQLQDESIFSSDSTTRSSIVTGNSIDVASVQPDCATPAPIVDSATQATAPSLSLGQLSAGVLTETNQGKTSLDDETEKIFFSQRDNEHNLKYLLCNSHGLQKTIWRILSQLTILEFKTFTSINNGQSFYENESMLSRCYDHVISKGNWPPNLYVKFPMLHDLLLKKGVQDIDFKLDELSPKILHWKDLSVFTNFDEIVELMYLKRTKHKIDDYVTLCDERLILYEMCWRHNRWVLRVPDITNMERNESLAGNGIPTFEVEPYRFPPCMAKDRQQQQVAESPTVAEVDSSGQSLLTCAPTQLVTNGDSDQQSLSTCPPTQLDINLIQDTETQNDSLPSITIESGISPSEADHYKDSLCLEGNTEQLQETLSGSVVDVDSAQQNLSECPPTQLNLSNFVDVGLEIPSSEALETQNDPLLETSILMPNVPTNSNLPVVKNEPIKFLDHLRFICNNNSNEDFLCEPISADENIIVIDDDSEMATMEKLKCFNQRQEDKTASPSQLQPSESSVNPPTETPMPTAAIIEQSETQSKENSIVREQATTERSNNAEGGILPTSTAGPEKRVACKRKPVGKDTIASKKPRGAPDFVAQLKHSFRPLPLNAMVRIETDSVVCVGEELQGMPQQQSQPQTDAQLTASQAFAIDDTLLKSSQLQELLDGPNVAGSKVNEGETSVVNRAASRLPPITLSSTVVYRQLKSYVFIRSLTMAQTREYCIDSVAVGQPYQQATIQVMKRIYHLKGPLLQALFPYISPTLLADLKYLLCSVEKLNWDSRDMVIRKNLDLRLRVLSVFINVAPRFGHFRLKYENDSFNCAACSLISAQDQELEKRQPVFDVTKAIKPRILDNMRQFSKDNKKK
ncbi:protein telomere ends associated isoform X2 [Drosophila willistoni]|uniref:protein telomere ends associated isoform X2 n=1 Tax=Drosophila willistoni TaxID=7260 RepID=UPI000C26CE89|nr:protein telomere ends associated isoform X2 [Drosophila willistoni]